MTANKSSKRKIIIILVIVIAVLGLIGSFFIRDLLLRSGNAEFDRKEIVSVKNKYSRILDNIVQETEKNTLPFDVRAGHKGILEKSQIVYDENAEELFADITEQIDSICHSYCYHIYRTDKSIVFDFNEMGTKCIIKSYDEPKRDNDGDTVESLGDGWYYYEKA